MSDPVDPTPLLRSAPSEEEAWAALLLAWGDEEAHRAYVRRSQDLAGLAVAGARYRAALAERPGDAMAARMRDEVLKKATVYGLRSLPRTEKLPGGWLALRRVTMAGAVALGAALVWALARLVGLLGAPS